MEATRGRRRHTGDTAYEKRGVSLRKWIVWSGISLIMLLLAINIPVDTTNPLVNSDISSSPGVKAILQRACYDCHSNETKWPWYSRIAPLSWLLVWDVCEGRAELNFSRWNQYSTQQQEKTCASWEEITKAEMPPWFYGSTPQCSTLSRLRLAAQSDVTVLLTGRVRHRQGTGRTRHSRTQRQERSTFLSRQLLGYSRNAP
jgi:hypothetical protein